jgi:hypothetical protein
LITPYNGIEYFLKVTLNREPGGTFYTEFNNGLGWSTSRNGVVEPIKTPTLSETVRVMFVKERPSSDSGISIPGEVG